MCVCVCVCVCVYKSVIIIYNNFAVSYVILGNR